MMRPVNGPTRVVAAIATLALTALGALACSDPQTPGGGGGGGGGGEGGGGGSSAAVACAAIDRARDDVVGGLLEVALRADDAELFTDEEVVEAVAGLVPVLRDAAPIFAAAAGQTNDAELAGALTGLSTATTAYADDLEAAGTDRAEISAVITDDTAFESADETIRGTCFEIWNPDY